MTNLGSVVVNRNPSSDKELSTKNYIDDELATTTVLRFNQTLENYLKVTVRNDTYNLTKYAKLQFTDITEIEFPNIGSDLLQKWNIKCNNKNGDFKSWKIFKINHNKQSYKLLRSNESTSFWY